LRKFDEAYQEAVRKLPEYHMDVAQVLAEDKHAEFEERMSKGGGGTRTWLRTTAVAASLLFLCGVGTVTAMNYRQGIITVENTGYSITSQKMNVETCGEDTVVVSENTETAAYDGEKDEIYQKYVETMLSEDVQEAYSADTEAALDEVVEMEAEVTEPVYYSSIEEFRDKEDITVAFPQLTLLGEFEEESIMVMEDGAYLTVMLLDEERRFTLTQQDTRGYEGYASSTTFVGKSVNERSIMNDQGLSYVVFDTMEDGEIVSTHAVISVNGRDLCLDFCGYEEAIIKEVLKQLDLSIYFQD